MALVGQLSMYLPHFMHSVGQAPDGIDIGTRILLSQLLMRLEFQVTKLKIRLRLFPNFLRDTL